MENGSSLDHEDNRKHQFLSITVNFRQYFSTVVNIWQCLAMFVNYYQSLSIIVNSCQFLSIQINSRQFSSILFNSCQFLSILVNSCQFLSILVNHLPATSPSRIARMRSKKDIPSRFKKRQANSESIGRSVTSLGTYSRASSVGASSIAETSDISPTRKRKSTTLERLNEQFNKVITGIRSVSADRVRSASQNRGIQT